MFDQVRTSFLNKCKQIKNVYSKGQWNYMVTIAA